MVPHDDGASAPPAEDAPSSSGFLDDGKNTIGSQLASRLREAIISGELQAGSKINLDKARKTFNVSLSPLREGLARLISDGLVEFEDNRGYRVSSISLANLEEITVLREELEVFALRESMRIGDVEWEGNVMRALHRLNRTERDAARPETLERWEEFHREFHLTLISGCGKPILLHFCSLLLNLNDRYRRVFLTRTSGDRNVSQEHSEIAQGAVARDLDYACDMLRQHIHRTGTNLRNHLATKGTL
ncbi:MAG: FCD domain-containing protein [Mesorhizobium sp.]|uniref:GntR family transcriptional regulator n=2 Tax=Mesorhizobium TaxID=68287 RepID=UPI000F74F0F1|nr:MULTISPECIES: GntR family transcriptional regulator [unclassified Mesorhizobium]RVD73000.1 FCD domain-containing protein [Mesorhizobium sp. M4A.F.Ca.ET.029.04.2.1]AZO48796.1 GntR family transcriptional regulator [Mesorhizobium sp. M4B.F.Ca.ET.058.02.1.1]RUW28048.1 FCD domain-containing protein [Mesorhizobium sp. M4B.F.Ca.ET.013.02.1.1]RUW78647.1 FCD domain-containing protein [Mesorhizobium sp. M4B.F.Ca.ET.049.02.1.2]RUX52352.1 FCD domain-containing protein [Mesorhizobium sp. M4A.F.Ca.ET.050